MKTLAETIEDVAGEAIIACVIGDMGWSNYLAHDKHRAALSNRGRILEWAEARRYLSYEWDSGFGAPDCNAFYAWTEKWIVYCSQYDGSTTIERMPRNPTADFEPEMPGG